MNQSKYRTMNLPADVVEALTVWRQAYGVAKGRNVSYGEIMRGLMDGIRTLEPDVAAVMDVMLGANPELEKKMNPKR